MIRTLRWIVAAVALAVTVTSPTAHAPKSRPADAVSLASASAADITRLAQIRHDIPAYVKPANRVSMRIIPSAPTKAPVVVPTPPAIVAADPRPIAPVSTVVVMKPRSAIKRPAPALKAGPRITSPTWVQASCDNPDASGMVDVPSTPGLFYTLDGLPAPGATYLIGAGTHTVTASVDNAKWTFAVADMSAQCGITPLDTTPTSDDVPPVWHQATCEQPNASVDIPPSAPGIIYSLDDVPGPAGNYLIGSGIHTVTEDSGSADRIPTWTFTVSIPSC